MKFNPYPFKKFCVKQHEKALLFKEGSFIKILTEGDHWFLDFFYKYKAETYDLRHPEFDSDFVDFLVARYPDQTSDHFHIIDTSETEIGLVYLNNKLAKIIPPSARKAYWKGLIDIEDTIVEVKNNYEIDQEQLDPVANVSVLSQSIYLEKIQKDEVALLFVNGKFEKLLNEGLYAYWRYCNYIEFKRVKTTLQTVEVLGQEILTKDKISLRVNLTAHFRINDPVKYLLDLDKGEDYIYKSLQLAIRELVATNLLDELLAKKEDIGEFILGSATPKLSPYGIELQYVGIKDIIFPGDIRDIMNEVVKAEKQAQANLIKRREEVAATRSLLNTSKLIEDNPVLLRLKELETLEKLIEKINNLNVYNGLQGILDDLIKLKT